MELLMFLHGLALLTAISTCQKIWENQVLDHYGCCYDLLSYLISSSCFRILYSISRCRRDGKYPHFFTWWNFPRDHIRRQYFLSVAKTMKNETSLRNHMIIAGYGLLLFYIAGSAFAAQAAYPPYGLASVSFTGISCYLIFTGLYLQQL